jgi:uncharacterized protein with PhoU and TrkA domain
MRFAVIEQSIRKLRLRTNAKAEERILGDALAALESGARVGALRRGLSVLRMIRESLPVRLAGAAVLIAAIYIGGQCLAGRLESCDDEFALTVELACRDIEGFFGY